MRPAAWCLLALALVSCGDAGDESPVACTAIALAGLDVEVIDVATGQPVCDATVTASEGTYSERLFSSACRHSGAYERPGTYTIRAERAGYSTGTVSGVRVVMGPGPCPHPETRHVRVPLEPAR